MARELPARILIGLTGLVALVTGANVAFGGILTLGLEGSRDFVTIANPAEFAVHDSHTRFLAGLWVGIGFLFLASSIWLRGLRTATMCGLSFMIVGGLARLTQPGLGGLAEPAVVGSLLAELLLMPLLIWLLARGAKTSER